MTKMCIPKQFPYLWIYVLAKSWQRYVHLSNVFIFERRCMQSSQQVVLPLLCVQHGECMPWRFLQSRVAIPCPGRHWQPLLKVYNGEKCSDWRTFCCGIEFGKHHQPKQSRRQGWHLGGSEIAAKLGSSYHVNLHSINGSTEHSHWNQGCWRWNNSHIFLRQESCYNKGYQQKEIKKQQWEVKDERPNWGIKKREKKPSKA